MLVIYPQLSSADQTALLNGSNPTQPYIAPGYTYDTTPPQGDPTVTTHNPATDPTNQLPPVVQVTMIAVDEASASRIERQKASDASQPPTTLDGSLRRYFVAAPSTAPFTTSTSLQYNDDLQKLQGELVSQKMTYRTFTSNVSLRAAKWSRD